MKNWIFRVLFPTEYKIVQEIKEKEIRLKQLEQKELDETAYVRGVVAGMNRRKEELGENMFKRLMSSSQITQDFYVGEIAKDWQDRVDSKISQQYGDT